jgi:glycerol-3-phosphate dehydrogenase (NAD(P)+)
MKISIFGAGAWGTALALAAARHNDVVLWTRRADHALQMAHDGHNHSYLPGIDLLPALQLTSDHGAALRHAQGGLCVIATPMAALRQQWASLGPAQPALWLCKGFEAGSGALGHEVARAVHGQAACAVLSGPSFALEVARGQPTALVVASADAALAATAVAALHSDVLRIYTSTDVVGVEVGGAVKNVLAIAVGVLDGMACSAGSSSLGLGLGLGLNARAALITRGLAEMTRLGVALGGRAETFMGLSGLGDLVLTATGHLSRNRQVGLLLAQGQPLAQALAALGHVAEGVHSAPTVLARARKLGVDMPITEAVVELLVGQTAAVQVLARLMARDARAES